jgi:hypothetical protein
MFAKYVGLLTEYLVRMATNVSMESNQYFSFVSVKGIETVSHVFRLILLYTNNIDAAYYHANRAADYYIEFIGQIGDNNHSFLKLNSKDASLFVYKKTIFEISTDSRKEHSPGTHVVDINKCIFLLTELYSSAIKKVIDSYNYQAVDNPRDGLLASLHDRIKDYTQNLMDLSIGLTATEYGLKLEQLDTFWAKVSSQSEDPIVYTDAMVKRMRRKSVDADKAVSRLTSDQAVDKIKNEGLTATKFISWLCAPGTP